MTILLVILCVGQLHTTDAKDCPQYEKSFIKQPEKIVGGEFSRWLSSKGPYWDVDSRLGQFPWQAYIQHNKLGIGTDHVCGGVLIAANKVLTVA